ncbi:AbrB/MazE/SpoVT family DNA-binding domain-containing protein [Rhizobium sp. CG5]|uniref:type II toxin-antitoxin system PrlF family antitoxin n=1 Tax=Rhizobium sp. CG5 TaxID=2726076 RepID=UPI0020349B1D|nr:type II toxin-antitoxin system PrlF family antitoxin [Rhizobium sp. CG5]MCM2472975.1 AbrB/MazE/SpoVT family DNA-binding domain-containing protein [Rhizobium sp. CG5]
MAALLKKISTITEKGQVTVPKSVRDALGLGYGGRVAFYVDENRHVSIEKVDEADDDPVIDSFLGFLANDMEKHPERVQEFPKALVDRMAELTKGMHVNLDDPILGDVTI